MDVQVSMYYDIKSFVAIPRNGIACHKRVLFLAFCKTSKLISKMASLVYTLPTVNTGFSVFTFMAQEEKLLLLF